MSVTLETEFPLALDSPDHLIPLGTKVDNSRNHLFVEECEKIIHKKNKYTGTILDIGCAGGGCVEDFVAVGHDAYGIDGSDYSKLIRRASWGSIPDRLFTCDASRPFRVVTKEGKILLFDIIFSFEVMEHIAKDRLPIFFQNIYNHLANDGIFIGTFTTTKSEKFPQHHQTVMSRKKWFKFIEQLGLFKFKRLKWKKESYLRFSSLRTNCIPISFRKNTYGK